MPDDIEVGSFDEESPRDPLEKIKKLKDQLAHCEKEKHEYLDGWQRAKAELLNSKKDEARRLGEWRERLEEAMILEFLPVLDSFDLADSVGDEHASQEMKRGFELIRQQLAETFRRLGVSETPVNGAFDPARHEAIEEIDSGGPPGHIVEVLQKGYERNGRVLRPARVTVSK